MTYRHPDKESGMTIRLTLCERDATDRQTDILITILRTVTVTKKGRRASTRE